jgi:hypothetical protein
VAPHFGLTNLPKLLLRYSRVPFERMSRSFGQMNTQTTFTRCLRRTPDFEDYWFDHRALLVEMSFAETSSLSGSAISRQDRSDLPPRAGRKMISLAERVAS